MLIRTARATSSSSGSMPSTSASRGRTSSCRALMSEAITWSFDWYKGSSEVGREIGEGVDALSASSKAHPLEEDLALVDPLVEQDAKRSPDERDAVLPALVLEVAEVEPEDDLVELRRGVAGCNQRRRDCAGGCAGHVLGLVPVRLEGPYAPASPIPLTPPPSCRTGPSPCVDLRLLAAGQRLAPVTGSWSSPSQSRPSVACRHPTPGATPAPAIPPTACGVAWSACKSFVGHRHADLRRARAHARADIAWS